MTRWRMGGKKTMAVLLAASMLGAGMSGAVLPGVQTAQAETLSLTLTAKDNQTIVITDEGYTLISYNPYNSSIETGRESAAYTGDYIITGGTADKPLSEARIRIETTECSLTLKNYHASTTKTANLVDSLVMTEQTNSLLWNNIEDSKMNLKVEGTNSLTCSSQSGSHDIGILKGSLTIQGGGKLYMSNVDIANRETGGTIIFDGPSVRSLNSNDSRGINTFGNVKVRSGELYMKTSATSVKASDMSIEGGIVAAGSVMAGTVEVSGAAVLYMTSRTDGTLTATEGIVYNGTVIGFKNTSSASADRWTPVLTGGTGTLYGDPQLAESSYTKPDNSNIGIDLATAGKEDGVTMKLEDVGYTGNPAVPAPVIRVDKMALHKTLVRGVDFEAETDSSQADKIGLGEKKAVITAVDGSGNLNATEGSFQVVQSQTVFDGGVKTYKGEQETDEFGYGDTITVKVVPKPNGIPAATAAAAGAPPETMKVPVEGKAALYAGSTRLTEDVSVGADGSCSMSYDTNQGALKIGSAELTVRYTGNENMADTSETRTLGLGKTIISQQQVSVTPYTGIYDAATHEAVKVQTTGLEDVRASYSYSTDEGVTWSSYQDTCPLVQGAGTIYVKVRIRGDIYQDYETDPLTVSVARRNIAALPAGEL